MGELGSIEEAITAMASGRMVILVDDEDRENEGDLVAAASTVTAAQIGFMAREARGLICVAVNEERADTLHLTPMAQENTAPLGTAFTRSIAHRLHPGIGAADRAASIRAIVDGSVTASDFVTPGHVFPLRARPGGVLMRSGQTEGSVDLAGLAGLESAAVICEVMNPDGTMARLPQLLEFGRTHDIPVVTVADLIRYRLRNERLVRFVNEAALPTVYGEFRLRCYENAASGQVHLALIVGDITKGAPPLVRVHRSDTLADVFGLRLAPSRSRLAWSLERMAQEGRGVLLYLRHDRAKESLEARVSAYVEPSPHAGESKAPAMPSMGFHDFGIGAQILSELGLHQIRVITNRPRAFKGLSGFDLEIVDWIPIDGKEQ